MFSGIVESQATVLKAARSGGSIRIEVQKPLEFNDLKIGDSIAVDGVCLTVEEFDRESIAFTLGAETLQVTTWNENSLSGKRVNLERSLRFGDRVHGHFVSGHVDSRGEIVAVEDLDGSTLLAVKVDRPLLPYLWKKGSWALNGVSLTINAVDDTAISVCLIPETLRRTNLGDLKVGDPVNVEVDPMARGFFRMAELNLLEHSLTGRGQQ